MERVDQNGPQMDAIDRALIRELQLDGRRSNVSLGEIVGLSEGAVRRRIDRLQALGILRFAAVPDPIMLGFAIHALIGFEIDPRCVDEVRESLVATPELRYLYEGMDRFGFVGAAYFKDDDQLEAFLSNGIAHRPGIRQIEVFRVTRSAKKSGRWDTPIPEDLADARVHAGRRDA